VCNFFAEVSSKIIALADPILSQPDMEREMVSPPAGAYIPSFTIYHVLPDLPGTVSTRTYTKDTFCPDLPISEGVLEHTNARGLPQLQEILPDLSCCFCTWKEGCLFITSDVL
jgi:hypothetical protein